MSISQGKGQRHYSQAHTGDKTGTWDSLPPTSSTETVGKWSRNRGLAPMRSPWLQRWWKWHFHFELSATFGAFAVALSCSPYLPCVSCSIRAITAWWVYNVTCVLSVIHVRVIQDMSQIVELWRTRRTVLPGTAATTPVFDAYLID